MQAFGEIAYPTPTILELDPATQAARFREALRASKAVSPIGPQVTLADEADYQTMRLFITEDGRSGFALKSDGDIVSVFSGGGGVLHALVALAVQEGGTKLDCFNTMLPRLYSVNGFRIVARDAWNDAYTPEGWDFKAMARFNNGRPDVVYMEYDEASLQQPGEQTQSRQRVALIDRFVDRLWLSTRGDQVGRHAQRSGIDVREAEPATVRRDASEQGRRRRGSQRQTGGLHPLRNQDASGRGTLVTDPQIARTRGDVIARRVVVDDERPRRPADEIRDRLELRERAGVEDDERIAGGG